MRQILSTIITFLLCTMTMSAKYVLVIDAGHGGHDAGAVGSFSKEKNINLAAALAFGQYVERNCPDVKVIYTRKTDVFIPLHQRADIANKNHADVFISIHTNALPAGRIARGVETYTMGMRRSNEKLSAAQRENSVISYESDYRERYEGYDPNSPESAIMFEFINDKNMEKSIELARYVQKNICSTSGRPDKGVKQDVFLVLRETSMPACLIELGYISTPDEERILNDPAQIDNIARGIYQAFIKYKGGNYANAEKPVPHVAPSPSSDKEKNKETSPKENSPTKNTIASRAEEKQNAKAKAEKKKEEKAAEKPVGQPDTKPEAKPVKKQESKQEAKQEVNNNGKPVFKVQILTSDRQLKNGDSRLKGHDARFYKENNIFKYTLGESTDYNEINKLRRQVAEEFPGAFIIAFKDGNKMDVNKAIQEFKTNRRQ